jgi:hypothetical protein
MPLAAPSRWASFNPQLLSVKEKTLVILRQCVAQKNNPKRISLGGYASTISNAGQQRARYHECASRHDMHPHPQYGRNRLYVVGDGQGLDEMRHDGTL